MVALPFLPSLWPREAWGQTLPVEKRFIAGWVPLGGYSNADLYPTYTADIVRNLYPGQDMYSTNLRISPGLGSISKIYSAALNPFISKLNVMQGLDCPITFTHGEATMLGHYRQLRGLPNADPNAITGDTLTKYPAVPSIDQFLAYSPHFYSSAPVLRSVVGYGNSSIGLVKPGDIASGLKRVSGPSTPQALFNALFGVSTPPVGGVLPTLDQTNSKTLIDHVLGDLTSTMKSRNISSTDKARLDSYTTELFELQKKLVAPSAAACVAPADPKINTAMGSLPDDTQRAQFLDLYASVLCAGIKCGRTRVASLSGIMQIGTQGKYSFDLLHGWGHNGKKTEVGDAMRWMIENFYVPILTKLDVDEGDGKTFLDNSLVMYGNQNSSGVHKNWDRPIIMAGSAGDFIKTGIFADYRQRGVTTRYGTPGILYNQLMVTILRAMGIPASDPMLAQYAHAELIVPSDPNSFWMTLKKDGTHPHAACIKDSGSLLPVIAA